MIRKFLGRFWPWAQYRNHQGPPVPKGDFRLVVLNDDPFPTYIGWRAWCSGKPFWDDGQKSCECRHSERKYG